MIKNGKLHKANMKDVARLAGVSQPTVSYVINGNAPISSVVKERVFDAINELGYTPNKLAKNLKSNLTNTIGLLLPNISNPYYAVMANELESRLRKHDKFTFLACTDSDEVFERLYIKEFISYNVAGIIITYSVSDASLFQIIKQNGIPFVVLDDTPSDASIPNIEIASETGGYLAARHLLDIGRKRIAFASEPMTKKPLKQRFSGYKRALGESGINGAPCFVADAGPDLFDMGCQIGEQLIHTAADVDAVFATSDYLALGILRKLSESGIHVPGDIALIGYDDILASKIVTPSLSTIAQPVYEMSEIGTTLLQNQISGIKTKLHHTLSPSLKARETTRVRTLY